MPLSLQCCLVPSQLHSAPVNQAHRCNNYMQIIILSRVYPSYYCKKAILKCPNSFHHLLFLHILLIPPLHPSDFPPFPRPPLSLLPPFPQFFLLLFLNIHIHLFLHVLALPLLSLSSTSSSAATSSFILFSTSGRVY